MNKNKLVYNVLIVCPKYLELQKEIKLFHFGYISFKSEIEVKCSVFESVKKMKAIGNSTRDFSLVSDSIWRS